MNVFDYAAGGIGMHQRTVHCISVDVEGFVEAMQESFIIPDKYLDPVRESEEICENTVSVLKLFDTCGVKGTFFILARIAEDTPEVVRMIAEEGHEVALHGLYHRRIYKQSPAEFERDIVRGKTAIEEASGQKVCGFRAPDFSIRNESLWALDILSDSGFVYDASLTPTNIHDVYGNPGTERTIHRLSNGMWEFPASTFSIASLRLPFGGGGYLRLYPTWFTMMLIRLSERSGRPVMLYIHPYEVGSITPRIEGLSLARRFRHYYGIRECRDKTAAIMQRFRFDTAFRIIDRCRSKQSK